MSFLAEICVRRLSVDLRNALWLLKRCVLELKSLLTAYDKYNYDKSIGTKMNDLDLCLEVVSSLKVMSTIALHSTLNIWEVGNHQRKAWFQGPPIRNGLLGIKWSRDR